MLAAIGSACFLWLPSPWGAAVAIFFLYARHVFDGADGLLARVTGKASMSGDLVDGVCDAGALIVVHLALVIHLSAQLSPIYAWPLAAAAIMSYIVQVRAYEGRRRVYLLWALGKPVITGQETQDSEKRGSAGSTAGRLGLRRISEFVHRQYLAPSAFESKAVSASMRQAVGRGGAHAEEARRTYRFFMKPVVKRFSYFSENQKTIATGAAMLAGSAIYLYAYLIVAMNILLVYSLWWQTRVDSKLQRDLVGAG
jgi:hypothetical protein